MKNILLVLAAFGLILGMSGIAMAGTATQTLTVDGTIVASCQFTNVPQALNFGNNLTIANLIDGILASAGPTAALTIICANTGTPAKLYSVGTREMAKGTDKLAYNIYLNSAGTTVLGAGLGDGNAVTADGTEQTINLYGRLIPGQATKPSGAYTQDITLTVEF